MITRSKEKRVVATAYIETDEENGYMRLPIEMKELKTIHIEFGNEGRLHEFKVVDE